MRSSCRAELKTEGYVWKSRMLNFRSWRTALQALLLLCLAVSISASATGKKKNTVCVIGAGGSGLASAKNLAAYPDEFDVVVFERNSDVGGVWLYSDNVDVDEHNLPVYSSMYKYLRTNLPKELMAFPDYRDFGGEDRSCVKHETVLAYLKNYTEHFNLRQYIKFNTFVEKVTPIVGEGDWRTTKWTVATRNLDTNTTAETTCNAVMVCNGHFFKPRVPKIPGIETFPGRVLHSHYYRKPEEFTNKTVVILGASWSGIDISNEIAQYGAKTIYLSHNKPKITIPLPENIIQVAGVISAEGNTLILKDGSRIQAEVFIFCTGYEYAFPFLDESSGLEVEDNRVAPLYKHMVNVQHPSMAFMGLPSVVVLFTVSHVQSRYYVALLRGKAEPLPTHSAMLEQAYYLKPGQKQRNAHALNDAQWAYLDELARQGGFEPLPAYYEHGYELWKPLFTATNLRNFKNVNMRIDEKGNPRLEYPENTN